MKLPFFKFHPDEWLTGKISFQNAGIQKAFIIACCIYWKKEGNLEMSDIEYRIKPDQIARLCDLGLIHQNGQTIEIDFLREQIDEYQEMIENKIKAGKASANKRKKSTDPQQKLTPVQQKTNRRPTEGNNKDKEEDKDKEVRTRVRLKPRIALAAFIFSKFLKMKYRPDAVTSREYNLYTDADMEMDSLEQDNLLDEALEKVKAYHEYCRITGQRQAMKFHTVINKAFEADWAALLKEESTRQIKPTAKTKVRNKKSNTVLELGSIANGLQRFGTEEFNELYELI